MIRAITFDLWDTLIRAESDEPARLARGLRSKRAERRHLIWEALGRHAPLEEPPVAIACDLADAAFDKVWHDHHVTWTIRERLEVLLAGLRRALPAGELARLVEAHERMELEVAPEPVEGMLETLAALAERYPLAVVSDTLVTPGWALRELLDRHGLARPPTADSHRARRGLPALRSERADPVSTGRARGGGGHAAALLRSSSLRLSLLYRAPARRFGRRSPASGRPRADAFSGIAP